MGFDNECILNIQSLAGEYFCPVCRTLVYPHEALQTQCTHLYCKPCLAYVVGSTQACPYDGYLVTEAGSKPLMESNKALAETIGKTSVHCLYHRSGCVWQGALSECTSHCSGCAFGNSPVVCNRCGLQIVHRQVQEHAQTCNVNGTNNQPQGSDTAQDAAVSVDQSKIANQTAAPASQPHQVAAQPQTATASSNVQNLNQTPPTNPLPQVAPATAVPAPEQWYQQQQQQQQYQQYYQQYPGYDPYQQQTYQQYYPYQQQPQNQPPVQPQPQSQPQIQAPVQPQPQIQPQPQPQAQVPQQFQMYSQAQPQIPSNVQPQPLYSQAAVVGSSQNQAQVNPQQQVHPGAQIQSQNQPLAHGHMPPQSYPQVQPHPVQSHAQSQPQPQPQSQMQVPQYQQPHSQMHYSQPPQVLPQAHPPFQPLPLPPPQSQPMNPQHPPVHSLSGHPSYPSQPHQPIQHAPPMQVQPPTGSLPPTQFPQPPPHMRPTQPPHMLPSQAPPTQQLIHPHNQPAHPRPIVHQVQQPTPQQYVQQPQAFPGQLHHAGPFAQVQPQPMQQPSHGFVQPSQGTALPPQSYMGRPPMLNQGGQSQQFTQPQSSGIPGIPPHARPPQYGPSQPLVNMTNQPHVYPEQQLNQYAPPLGGALVDRKGDPTFERRVEQQEDKSPSLKKSDEFRANFNEVKPETGINDELKTGNGGDDDHRKDEKDGVSELHQVQGVPGDSGIVQRVKEESKDGVSDHNKAEDGGVATRDSMKQGEAQSSSEVDNGSLGVPPGSCIQQGHHERSFSQSQTPPQGQIGDMSGGFPSNPAPLTEQGRSPHPQVPYPPSGQQQRPAGTPGNPPSHLRPPGHGYLPHGPHPGDHFQPPGSFHPDFPLGGPPNNSSSRGYEPQYNGRLNNRMSQGEPLGPSLPHGPDGQNAPRHPGPMESDIYHDQRPSHFNSRRLDSHIPGNVDRGPYPFGGESNSMRINGAPPVGLLDSRDEKFRTPDTFPMGHHEQGRLFPHLEDSPKYGSRSSRAFGGYGMDGPSRFFDKDPHGYGFDGPGSGGYLPPYHPNDSGGRPLALHHDDNINRGRFGPDFHRPMHGFGRRSLHNFDVDGREMERHSAGERFGPPVHMHRGEFDGPRGGEREPFGLRNRGSFQDYGEPNGPGGFSHKPPFGVKSARPHLGEPGFRSSYSRKGFPSDGGFFSGGPDSFDGLRKRNTYSMGWCRICKIDCESVEGLDMHGQTREHQRMAMDMVITIKQKNAKKHKASNDHSAREEPSKLRNTEVHARVNAS